MPLAKGTVADCPLGGERAVVNGFPPLEAVREKKKSPPRKDRYRRSVSTTTTD